MKDRRDYLVEKINECRKELNEIDSAEESAKAKALVGNCYRYRNNYSCDSVGWWRHYKVVGTEGGSVVCWVFEKTSDGKFYVEFADHCFGILPKSEPISQEEFAVCWATFKAEIVGK
jgi:hypothetical protein